MPVLAVLWSAYNIYPHAGARLRAVTTRSYRPTKSKYISCLDNSLRGRVGFDIEKEIAPPKRRQRYVVRSLLDCRFLISLGLEIVHRGGRER
jgi:hypothetical protein